jgi:hypothetical protein
MTNEDSKSQIEKKIQSNRFFIRQHDCSDLFFRQHDCSEILIELAESLGYFEQAEKLKKRLEKLER